MRRIFYFVACIAILITFWLVIRNLITGYGEQFGDGFSLGVGITVLLYFTAERIGFRQTHY